MNTHPTLAGAAHPQPAARNRGSLQPAAVSNGLQQPSLPVSKLCSVVSEVARKRRAS